jgi:hypothetical protein
MQSRNTARLLIFGIASLSLTLLASAETPKAAASDAEQIKSAESAAPAAVAKNAAVVTMEADGKMRTLRKGSNAFPCMPDNPATPGPDPMCGDANAMEWIHAWVAHKAPPAGKVGLMYMLEGGTDASKRPARTS